MSYIAFLDMLGTRSAAQISNEEYKSAINDFNSALQQVSSYYDCKIYGYSDNAYVEIPNIDDMLSFFSTLRKTLINRHRYFSAYVSHGNLNGEKVEFSYKFGNKVSKRGYSMKFTDSDTTSLYINQCRFKGIGVSISDEIVREIKTRNIKSAICQSVYLTNANNDEYNSYMSFYDIAYDNVILEELKYILSDYVMTTIINRDAGRYYVSPIISMIKNLNQDILVNQLEEVVSLLSFKNNTALVNLPNFHKTFPLVFISVLLNYVLSINNDNHFININDTCKTIIKSCNIPKQVFLEMLPELPFSVITNENKRNLVRILYNMLDEKAQCVSTTLHTVEN